MERLKRIAPYLLLGPISGPLVAAVTRNFRNGQPILGSLYAIVLIQYTILLPVVAVSMGVKMI